MLLNFLFCLVLLMLLTADGLFVPHVLGVVLLQHGLSTTDAVCHLLSIPEQCICKCYGREERGAILAGHPGARMKVSAILGSHCICIGACD